MLGETYEIRPDETGRTYTFTSLGPKGAIEKMVLFQRFGQNFYNLAFGDVQDGVVDDEVISNNQDFVKILGTVAKCVYHFVGQYPSVMIGIVPVDDGRKMLYNTVFRRHHVAIAEKFYIFGQIEGYPEPYEPGKLYDEFELKHKI